jgi:hypothetical protein
MDVIMLKSLLIKRKRMAISQLTQIKVRIHSIRIGGNFSYNMLNTLYDKGVISHLCIPGFLRGRQTQS